jgi:hypothetical protein
MFGRKSAELLRGCLPDVPEPAREGPDQEGGPVGWRKLLTTFQDLSRALGRVGAEKPVYVMDGA